MIDRLMRIFAKFGDGLLGMFIKLMAVLLAIVIVVAMIRGSMEHWMFVLTFLIGILLSPFFYTKISKKFKVDLPEYFFWGISDTIDTLIPNDETYRSVHEELKQKREAATALASEMEAKARDLERAANLYVKERKIKTKAKGEIKGPVTTRMKKAMLMQLSDEEGEIMKALSERQKDISWEKYL